LSSVKNLIKYIIELIKYTIEEFQEEGLIEEALSYRHKQLLKYFENTLK
jgi:hypothetical protein